MCSALVAWNRLLFEVFIPSTWASLLPVLLEKDAFTSIYNAWPPSQPAVKVGDFVYWNDLPSNVLLAISRNKLAVWPVVGVNNSSEMNVSFSDLGSLLVATKDDDPETLMSLASAGVKMTQPPEYIKELLLRAKVDFVLLDPETARQVLLVGNAFCTIQVSYDFLYFLGRYFPIVFFTFAANGGGPYSLLPFVYARGHSHRWHARDSTRQRHLLLSPEIR